MPICIGPSGDVVDERRLAGAVSSPSTSAPARPSWGAFGKIRGQAIETRNA